MVFCRWVKAVFKQWWADVTGGALVLMLALYSELSGYTVPPRIYEIAVIIALFQAMFLAWRKEETGRVKAEKQLADCQTTNATRTDIREELGAQMAELQLLRARCFKGEDLSTLEPDIINGLTKFEEFLASRLGNSYVVRSRNSSGLPLGAFTTGRFEPRPREIQLYGALGTRLARLEEFTKELLSSSTALPLS
jgi:hypothetical protein